MEFSALECFFFFWKLKTERNIEAACQCSVVKMVTHVAGSATPFSYCSVGQVANRDAFFDMLFVLMCMHI